LGRDQVDQGKFGHIQQHQGRGLRMRGGSSPKKNIGININPKQVHGWHYLQFVRLVERAKILGSFRATCVGVGPEAQLPSLHS
jgi:hypothetical protein